MAIGPILGGLLIDRYGVERGTRTAFGIALAMAAVAAVLQQLLIEERPEQTARSRRHAALNPLRILRGMTPSLRNLLVSDILVRFCEQMPYAYLAIWAMRSAMGARISGTQFGILTAIEMATAMAIYVPIGYLADRSHKKPFVVMTFIFFALFPLALLFSTSYYLLIGAFILRGLKEFGEPTRKALIMDLAPEERKAATFGAYYWVRDSIVTLGAALGALLWHLSPVANLLTAFAFGCLGTLWFAIKGRDLR